MESRQFHRLLLQVDILHRARTERRLHRSKTKNISLGGICITTFDEVLVTGAVYILKFILPGMNKSIKTKGRIVCSRQYTEGDVVFFDNGVEFLSLNKKYKKMIEEYSIGSVNL